MTTRQLFVSILLAIAISAISVMAYHFSMTKKTAYIEIKKVFNAFSLKKELEEKYSKTASARSKMIDSLTFNLQLLSKQVQSNKTDKNLLQQFDMKRSEFFELKERLEEDNAALSRKYDAQILEQMTQYVSDYGKKHHYQYIYGADGNGTIMYASEYENLTDEIVTYINNKYKGVE